MIQVDVSLEPRIMALSLWLFCVYVRACVRACVQACGCMHVCFLAALGCMPVYIYVCNDIL